MTTLITTAKEFMRRNLVKLSPDTCVIEGVSRLLKDSISGAPVIDPDGRYLGVFSEKCCMNALTDAVEIADECGLHIELAKEFMTKNLVTLTADTDVFEAIDYILAHRISGAPVVEAGRFQGVFSEKTAMHVLIVAAYENFPGAHVGAYMNTDQRRIIHEDATLLEIAHTFQQTPYRRLPVLDGDRLLGQVSRRDVLRSELQLATKVVQELATEVVRQAEHDDEEPFQSAGIASVGEHMDREARTISPDADLLSIAQVFLTTPYRRLPVIEDGRLVGQISRRDLLSAAADVLRPKTSAYKSETLYLSPLSDKPPSLP